MEHQNESQPTEQTKEDAPKVRTSTLEERNGVRRPNANTVTGSVWEAADRLSAKLGRPATRKEVTDDLPADTSAGTINTQYGKWRTFYGLAKVSADPDAKAKKAAEAEEAKRLKKEAQAAEKAAKAAEKAAKAAEAKAEKAAKAAEAKAAKAVKAADAPDTTVV